MRYLILMSVFLGGCSIGGIGSSKEEGTPVKYDFCVLSNPHKVGDEKYKCNVTARFDSMEACRIWRDSEEKLDPSPYTDGRVRSKCAE